MPRSMALTNVSRSDAAKTDAALTSATPIISAAAVAEVRLGARPALSRASWPGAPYTLLTGQPIMRVTGLAMVDATLAVPRNISSAPPPASRIRPGVPPGRANSPTRKSTVPMITVTVPATRRFELSAAKPSSGRIAATGGILAARRAGMMTAHIVMPTPTSERHQHRARLQHEREVGEAGAGGVEDADDQLGDEHPAADADDRGDHRHDQRFDDDQPAHLASTAADGAQQRQLAQALADRDGEDVVDEERADEGGDEGEDQQAGPERADERIDRAHRLLVERVARDHLDVVGQGLFERLLHGVDVGAVGDSQIDGVVDAFGTEHLGGGVEVEHRHTRPTEAVGGPEADQADDRERVQAGGRDDRDRVTDGDVLLLGGGLVDDGLGRRRSGPCPRG